MKIYSICNYTQDDESGDTGPGQGPVEFWYTEGGGPGEGPGWYVGLPSIDRHVMGPYITKEIATLQALAELEDVQ